VFRPNGRARSPQEQSRARLTQQTPRETPSCSAQSRWQRQERDTLICNGPYQGFKVTGVIMTENVTNHD
jgi:hypothetical protein